MKKNSYIMRLPPLSHNAQKESNKSSSTSESSSDSSMISLLVSNS